MNQADSMHSESFGSPPLKMAVIGVGHLGRIHARLIQSIPGADLVAVVDPRPKARSEASREFQVLGLEDYRQLYGKVDAAVIAAPTRLHRSLGQDLLLHGIHVLVEKPLAESRDQARELVAAAARAKRVLQVGHIEQFNPAWLAVRPHLGRPRYIEAERCSGFSFRSTDIGVVHDLMIHDLDLVVSLAGDVTLLDIQGLGISVFGKLEDMAQARLQFSDGLVVNLTASRVGFRTSRQMTIFDATACARIDFSVPSAELIRPQRQLLSGEFDSDSLADEEKQRLIDNSFADLLPRTILEVEPQNALLNELADFVSSIQTGSMPRVSGQQGLDAVEIADGVVEAIHQHHWDNDAGSHGAMFRSTQSTIVSPAAWSAMGNTIRKAG